MKLRKEFDSIGSINVPNDKYWGASTQRSNKFFNIGKILVNISIIKSIAIIKRSAALVHFKEKQIDKKITNSIIKASDEVIKGKLDENFPLKVWQTGSGTQTNMNVNEVLQIEQLRYWVEKKVQKNLFIQMIMSINLNLLMMFFQQLCIYLLLKKLYQNYYQI